MRFEDEMKLVELRDAASGELYRLKLDDISLIMDKGGDGKSCLLTLAVKQLVVEGSTAELLKKINMALR
jgi:hypothetical protein